MTGYVDSVESSSAIMSFLLLEIANRPEVQEKLRTEILAVGKPLTEFDLDDVNSLTFLGMVFNGL